MKTYTIGALWMLQAIRSKNGEYIRFLRDNGYSDRQINEILTGIDSLKSKDPSVRAGKIIEPEGR